MLDIQKKILEFHKKFGVKIGSKPELVDFKTAQLRDDLIDEEFKEFSQSVLDADIVGIADALGDLIVVVVGAAISYGIDLEPVLEEIHRSNMTKLWDDGTVHYAHNGKVLKPPTYSPANIKKILIEQGCQFQETVG